MPNPDSYLASSQARSVACVMDLCAAALVLVPWAFATYAIGTPGASLLEFGLVFFAYQIYFLQFKHGCTPGKHVRNICVVSARGGGLQPWQCVVRATAVALPWVLIGMGDMSAGATPFISVAPRAPRGVGMLWLFADLLSLEYLHSRRTLADRMARTRVVSLPPVQPHAAPAVPMYSAAHAEFGHPPCRPPAQ